MNEFSGFDQAAVTTAPEDTAEESSEKIRIAGVRLRFGARPIFHLAGEIPLRVGDKVVVETEGGEEEFGEISESTRIFPARYHKKPLQQIRRRAGADDLKKIEKSARLEADALGYCRKKIKEMKLPMHLLDVKYTFSQRNATFFFSADGRVDFRRLVRALTERFSVRVEMRQLGARDEAKIKGGCGPCGRTLCCSSFLLAFDPISVRMAKDQNLSLNPSKLSGACGRLKCCLRFEHSHYVSVKKKLPACKKKVGGCNCGASVIRQDILKEEVTLSLENGERMVVHADELERMPNGQYALKNPLGENQN